MSQKAVVVNYGIGNVFSVCNALKAIEVDVDLTDEVDKIMMADRLILPGVGAFARAMDALHSSGLTDVLHRYAETGRPFMGICIGMQVLMERSTEFGTHEGLGIIKGEVRRIAPEAQVASGPRVPHIGWSNVEKPTHGNVSWDGTPLVSLTPGDETVYFVHSYHCIPSDPQERLAITQYDGLELTAAIRHENVFGVQFHPERSGEVGQGILREFAKL